MANRQYDREASGHRFSNKGMVTNRAPDALQPGEYQLLLNSRSYSEDQIRCRPGMQLLFDTATGAPIRNVQSYSNGTGEIRYLASSGGHVFTDAGANVDSSFSATEIQAMIPYRPNQSVDSWMYVADGQSYRKFSFPNSFGGVLNQKVGIAEPQSPVDAAIAQSYLLGISNPGGGVTFSYETTGGGLNSGIIVDDTVLSVFQDPVYASLPITQLEYIVTLVPTSLGSSTYPGSGTYEIGKFITIGQPSGERAVDDAPWQWMVRDVYPSLIGNLNISSIRYYSGSTGRCVIVPANQGISDRSGQTIYTEQILTSLRRGSIVKIGAEECMVLSVTEGPQGTICFEVSTSSTHTTSDVITGAYAIRVLFRTYTGFSVPGGAPTTQYTPQVGDSIYHHSVEVDCGTGINTLTSSALVPANPFNLNGIGLRDDDFIHLAIWTADLTKINEIKLLIDVAQGSVYTGNTSTGTGWNSIAYTEDYYYYTVRPADYVNAVANTLTQLGAAQLATQRQVIDEEARQHGLAISSAQQAPGSGAWSHIFFRLRDFQRVGNDQTRTLMNANSFQLLFNCSATVDTAFASVDVFGGYSPDVLSTGVEYRYRIRPRSSVTGAKGNPSPDMRYGVRPNRQSPWVVLPTSAYDPQFDQWDIFRLGGVLDEWTFAGNVPVGIPYFEDNYDDTTISNSEQLDFDNLEPWPSIDVPFTSTAAVVGTTAVVTPATGSSSLIGNYLPGNKVQVGQQVFTLWTRPINLGSTWLFQFQENADTDAAGTALTIYEPSVANQMLPVIFGPTDQGGVIFGIQDPLRPGTVSYCKNFNPDSAPSNYTLELSSPSEPMMGGLLVNGQPLVCSSKRKWTLVPSFTEANKWTERALPGGGLASNFGLCTDGLTAYLIGKDGVYAANVSLTHDSLSNIFPEDGTVPITTRYMGTFYPPDFTKANLFRLEHCLGYIYFDCIDLGGAWQTFVYDISKKAWSVDQTLPKAALHRTIGQPQTSTSAGSSPTLPVSLLIGGTNGKVYEQVDGIADDGENIIWTVVTWEDASGDLRALKEWGDAWISLLPSSNNATIISLVSGGNFVSGTSVTVTANVRTSVIVPANNSYLFSLGIQISMDQSFADGEVPGVLYLWQPSWIPQPVIEAGRFTDWESGPFEGNGFWQGFKMRANTNGVNKILQVRDADLLALHPFTPSPVNFAQESQQAFSFNLPFIAHTVRIEPGDVVDWNLWDVEYVKIPYPEACETWTTEGMSHGMKGFQHLYYAELAYVSTAVVTLTITTDTGYAMTVTAPATGLQLSPNKVKLELPANKGKIFTYSFTSSAPFYLFRDMCEVWCHEWGSPNGFQRVNMFGGATAETAEV